MAEARHHYIVAEIKNDGVEFAWTSAVYADVRDALAERADAQAAGIEQRIFQLRPMASSALVALRMAGVTGAEGHREVPRRNQEGPQDG